MSKLQVFSRFSAPPWRCLCRLPGAVVDDRAQDRPRYSHDLRRTRARGHFRRPVIHLQLGDGLARLQRAISRASAAGLLQHSSHCASPCASRSAKQILRPHLRALRRQDCGPGPQGSTNRLRGCVPIPRQTQGTSRSKEAEGARAQWLLLRPLVGLRGLGLLE